MRIVIDIDDNLYTRLFDNGVDNYDDAVDMAKAIRKGTPYETVTEFADRCHECGAKYGKLLKLRRMNNES